MLAGRSTGAADVLAADGARLTPGVSLRLTLLDVMADGSLG